MSRPDPANFAVLADLGGRPLDAARLESTALASDALWDGLLAMREVPLSFVDAIEPGHAVARLSARRDRS